MNHINHITLTGTIVNLTPVLLLQTSRRSGSIQPADIIPCALSTHLSADRSAGDRKDEKVQDKKQEEPTTTPCKTATSTQTLTQAVPATLPCKDAGGHVTYLHVGDTVTVEGYYESNWTVANRRRHLSTYVRVESITRSRGTPAESNTETVRGYVARLGEPRQTRTGYSVTDVLVATCTPSGEPAYLPTAIFANSRYPRLRLHGPVTLTGRLQQRRYTASDGHKGVCWELVPWWVGADEHSDADTYRLRAVSRYYEPEPHITHCNTNTSEGTLDDWVTEPLDDSWLEEEL